MANIQVGKYLYNTIDLPFAAKVLTFINNRNSGVSLPTIADQAEIKADFNGDIGRTQSKVKVVLSNLRFRNVIQEVQKEKASYFKILNKDDALTLIAEGAKIINRMTQNTAEAANIKDNSAMKSNSKSNKVNTMSSKKTPKTPRLFVNPETSKIEPFGAGRPSKLKLAHECNSDGQFLNPANALAFAQNGGKSDDKLTKAELLDLLRQARAERDTALEAVKALMNTEASDDDSNALDLEAEAVDSDDDSETVEI